MSTNVEALCSKDLVSV